jgi:hypothetical protein
VVTTTSTITCDTAQPYPGSGSGSGIRGCVPTLVNTSETGNSPIDFGP